MSRKGREGAGDGPLMAVTGLGLLAFFEGLTLLMDALGWYAC